MCRQTQAPPPAAAAASFADRIAELHDEIEPPQQALIKHVVLIHSIMSSTAAVIGDGSQARAYPKCHVLCKPICSKPDSVCIDGSVAAVFVDGPGVHAEPMALFAMAYHEMW